jgi:hypothetical protein
MAQRWSLGGQSGVVAVFPDARRVLPSSVFYSVLISTSVLIIFPMNRRWQSLQDLLPTAIPSLRVL